MNVGPEKNHLYVLEFHTLSFYQIIFRCQLYCQINKYTSNIIPFIQNAPNVISEFNQSSRDEVEFSKFKLMVKCVVYFQKVDKILQNISSGSLFRHDNNIIGLHFPGLDFSLFLFDAIILAILGLVGYSHLGEALLYTFAAFSA